MMPSILNNLFGGRTRSDLASARNEIAFHAAQMQTEIQNLRIDLAFVMRRLDDLSMHLGVSWDDPKILIQTDFPVAVESADHTHPRGTANDNTRHPRFVRASEKIFGQKVTALDIGCSGGGLVFDFLQQGHIALGIEGSDYSLKMQRAYWSLLPKHLFTCDASKPFQAIGPEGSVRFDLITAWELLEHIPAQLLPGLFSNIHNHLNDDGLFVASVATFPDFDPATGVVWHVTLHDRAWWSEQLQNCGLEVVESPYEFLDYPRGAGNPLAIGDWNAATNPERGFHIAARRKRNT
jgi:2-polyprenyl-3-methyl-5-hydroxy-6-metoxy-1,4-benzoquinol methylase